jgi:hypothetical protein
MENNDIIRSELKELTPAVANINRRNVYSVPFSYFLDLPEQLLSFVKQHSQTSTLAPSAMPFKVPDAYFSGLSDEILKKVKQQHSANSDVERELADIAPILNTISKNPPHTVPAGYFENLEARKDKSSAKVVSLNKGSRFLRYAAAAAITGLVAIGGIFYANNDTADNALSAAPKFDQQKVKQLSDEEILNYLNSDPAATDIMVSNKDSEKQLINYTRDLTDEEISNFLEEHGEVVEIEDQEG